MGDNEETKESAESMLAEVQKRITDAFNIFDHESNKTVDVREVGTIIRSLGCYPSESELHDILADIEEEESTGYIKFDRFLPTVTQILLERRYRPASEDMLLKAFQTLDETGSGIITQARLTKLLTEGVGEPFSAEEMEEMLSQAADAETGDVVIRDFVPLLVADE